MDNELVSIITPLYKAEKYIEETINSVLSQTYFNFEWIIVDDCSPDNSKDIVKKYNDKRIILIELKENGGTANARNVALNIAKGKYVTFLDSDDLLDPCYLEMQVNFIKDNGPLISSGYRRMAAHTTTTFYPPEISTYKSILNGNPLSCLTTMYDFEIFSDMRFPLDTTRHEDFVFWYKMLKRGCVAKGNHQILATYRIYEGSRNKSKIALVKPMYDVYRRKLHFLPIRSLYHVFRMALYSKKKYSDVN